MEFSSKLIEKAVNEMSQLPGIGKSTAAIGIAFIKTTQGTNRFYRKP
jgi:recombinational DNA repair protein RecR